VPFCTAAQIAKHQRAGHTTRCSSLSPNFFPVGWHDSVIWDTSTPHIRNTAQLRIRQLPRACQCCIHTEIRCTEVTYFRHTNDTGINTWIFASAQQSCRVSVIACKALWIIRVECREVGLLIRDLLEFKAGPERDLRESGVESVVFRIQRLGERGYRPVGMDGLPRCTTGVLIAGLCDKE